MSVDILGTSWDQYVSMVQCSFMSTETIRLVRTDSPGRPPRLSLTQLLNNARRTKENNRRCTVLDMPDTKGNDRADRLVGRVPSQMARNVSDDPKWPRGVDSDTACGHKAKDIAPSIVWTRGERRGKRMHSTIQ